MIRRPLLTPQRRGFTLVEVLVVIGIVLILASLLTGAVWKAQQMGKRTVAASEISQLATALEAFKRDFGVYPPQRFTIPATITDPADEHVAFLKQMFPTWRPATGPSGLQDAGTILNSDQCLVYFLGGPRDLSKSIEGFSGWNPRIPAAGSGGTAKGPYYTFKPDKIKPYKEFFGGANTFPYTFIDPWGSPYAYIRVKDSDMANSAEVKYSSTQMPKTITQFRYTGASAGPFAGKPVNPGGVQIISAGPNGQNDTGGFGFGSGGAWAPGSGEYAEGASGSDDIANFNSGVQLGTTP